jgi:ectoine hydroxylase
MSTAVLEKPIIDLYPSRVESEPRFLERRDPVVYGGAEDGPLDAETLKFYEENGYLSFEQLFSESELAPYIGELKRLQNDEVTKASEQTITELNSGEVRSIFAVDAHNEVLRQICHHPRLVGIARQLLGSEIYIHQSRINYKPGFKGKEFYWHSDFETWHVEDGMPRMRAVSCSLSLTPNTPNNGPLMVIPGSHKKFLSCVGETPEDHYKHSLKKQEYGVPDEESLTKMAHEGGIIAPTGPAGSVTFFECNLMHGSNSNITPDARSNVFMVFNSVENTLQEPFCGLNPRPDFIAQREDYAPIPYTPESR